VIDDALQLVSFAFPGGPSVGLANVPGETRTWGTEALVRYHAEPWHVTATHTWTRATEPDALTGGRREVPVTPRHQAGVVGMWEAEGQGRVGVEFYYTGRQSLDDNPYRSTSRPYLVVGLLLERRIAGARWFINAENLLDARQTRWDPLPLLERSRELRWTTDAWAPLEGRSVNAGVRLDL
jgi:iron complex outermembrane receptor protein